MYVCMYVCMYVFLFVCSVLCCAGGELSPVPFSLSLSLSLSLVRKFPSVLRWPSRAPNCQRNFECAGPVNTVVLHPNQAELISGDQNGNIRVWDLVANTCSRELVPDGETAIRSISVAPQGNRLVAANNLGKCFVWQLGDRDTSRFDPLQKIDAHATYVLKCLISPDSKYKLWSFPSRLDGGSRFSRL
jgi:WD40 repeat protein